MNVQWAKWWHQICEHKRYHMEISSLSKHGAQRKKSAQALMLAIILERSWWLYFSWVQCCWKQQASVNVCKFLDNHPGTALDSWMAIKGFPQFPSGCPWISQLAHNFSATSRRQRSYKQWAMDVAAQWNLQRLRLGICKSHIQNWNATTQSWYFLLHLLYYNTSAFSTISAWTCIFLHLTFGPSDSTSAWINHIVIYRAFHGFSKIIRQIFAHVAQWRTMRIWRTYPPMQIFMRILVSGTIARSLSS